MREHKLYRIYKIGKKNFDQHVFGRKEKLNQYVLHRKEKLDQHVLPRYCLLLLGLGQKEGFTGSKCAHFKLARKALGYDIGKKSIQFGDFKWDYKTENIYKHPILGFI